MGFNQTLISIMLSLNVELFMEEYILEKGIVMITKDLNYSSLIVNIFN